MLFIKFCTVSLRTHNKNYVVTSVEGLTPPKAKINLSNVVGMDGSLFNSSKTETRNLVLTVRPQDPVEKNRQDLYKYAQIGGWCKIYYSNGSLDVQIEGYVEAIEGSLFKLPQTVQISILCPQPYFEVMNEIINDVSSLISNFEFPFAIEESGIEFSYINHDVLSTVINHGDVETGVLIYITARSEVVNPIIYDNYGGKFAIDITLSKGDQIVINTKSGERSVKLISGTGEENIINKVRRDSTWFTLYPGENVFSYGAKSGLDFMSIVFRHRTKFGGV